MMGPLVHDLLIRSAAHHPEALLAIDGTERGTYGGIDDASSRVAAALAEEGVARGDRVGLVAENSIAYVVAYYGILKAGAIVVALSPASEGDTLREPLSDCGAKVAIVGPRQRRALATLVTAPHLEAIFAPGDLCAAARSSARGPRLVDLDAAVAVSEPRPPLTIGDHERAAIVYTSGSTRKPRGVVLRHANLVANIRSIVAYLRLTKEDRAFVVLPFHYVYGKSILNTHVAVGASVVLENQFLYPQRALDRLESERATGLSGVPSTFAILLNKSNFASRPWPDLRYVTQAGGAMAPELTRRLMAALPGKQIFIMYGATEAAARLSYLDPQALPRKVGSIGKAIPGVELKILREDGTETEVGEVGEIVARGPNLMEGYWNDPVETAAVLDTHGYHTGDLGRRDDEGDLYVVGRKREMIKSGAHRISPKEIEETLVEHPAVDEAAVLGVEDEILGEAIMAFVTPRPGTVDARSDVLTDWCRRKLPLHKVPGRIDIVAELPRNASGKIDKLALAVGLSTSGRERAR
ncbi:MAG TPA: class I adenylate-forming enzyme family protein [Candidatus Polarisedimenticolaceae bacterium]|nr:class I adenylate-forming enzyme family protein [Candidatus Polarisedimenticolaceae bacterium]